MTESVEESDEEDESTGEPQAKKARTNTRVVDRAGAIRLEHILNFEGSLRVKYIELRDTHPWIVWMERFQSFLPGTTEGQRTWNRSLRQYWVDHGKRVWERFFWVGVGQYQQPGWDVSLIV